MVPWEGNIRICSDCDKLFIEHEEFCVGYISPRLCELCGKVTQDLHLIKKSVILNTLKSGRVDKNESS